MNIISNAIYGQSTIIQAAAAHIRDDNKSLLFVVFIPENRAAKCKETKSMVKFSKKYISMYKVFTTVTLRV